MMSRISLIARSKNVQNYLERYSVNFYRYSTTCLFSGTSSLLWKRLKVSSSLLATQKQFQLQHFLIASLPSDEPVSCPDKNSNVVHPSESKEFDKLYRSVEVECRGSEPAVLRSYHKFVTAAAQHLDIIIGNVEFPRYQFERQTLLKSVFIHKKHRVQYEIRTHFVIMKFLRLTSSTADTFLEYIQRNLPEGVSMKVTLEELCHLPEEVKASKEVALTPKI